MIRDILDSISDIFSPISRAQLSDFQKRKILHEFNTFYGKYEHSLVFFNDILLKFFAFRQVFFFKKDITSSNICNIFFKWP